MIERRLLARITDKKARLDALRPLPSAALLRLREQIGVLVQSVGVIGDGENDEDVRAGLDRALDF